LTGPLHAAVQQLQDVLEQPDHPREELEHAALQLEALERRVRQLLREAIAGPSTQEQVAALASAGLDDKTIAARLGLRRDYVVRLRTRAGVGVGRKRGPKPTSWREETRRALKQGHTAQELALAQGVTVRTAQNRMSAVRREEREQASKE
jgi:DNA-binding CsgD family transcriptional regulator